ncbi:MAG: UDP-N-acetylmuramoyl-tripeptide--D-alanyl-D-alanine ligase, partial [Gammaproteobacteria bacterium]
ISALSLEVSSHALDQKRFDQIPINYGIFTNLSHDHLDYHGNMQNYAQAKAKLFSDFNLKTAIFNLDDLQGQIFYEAYPGKKISYALKTLENNADIQAKILKASIMGTEIEVTGPFGVFQASTRLLGQFNISNLLAALAAVWAAGLPIEQIISAIPSLEAVKGRMELLEDPYFNKNIIVDYAHTPDGLEKVVQALSAYNSGLHIVFGCGGDRDRLKRPEMLKVLQKYADFIKSIVITQDNSRTEDTKQIITDILKGWDPNLGRTDLKIILDRKTAILQAILESESEDIVLIAGKGHENTQILAEAILPFSDQAVALNALLDLKNLEGLKQLLEAGQLGQFQVDSRKIRKKSKSGDVFVAIPGEQMDGHDFIEAAFEAGAAAVLAEKTLENLKNLGPIFQVQDTKKSLIQLAKWHLASLQAKHKIAFLAITGSQGKTSVKHLLASILSAAFGAQAVHCTQGNLNTDIGVPMSLLDLKPEHRYSIIEMGARRIGDISKLCDLVQPSVSLINNVGTAHIEIFGSRLGIANAKGEIYNQLSPQGLAIINLDDEFAGFWLNTLRARGIRVLSFALENQAADFRVCDSQVFSQASEFTVCFENQKLRICLPLPSKHNIGNALAAMAMAHGLGVDLTTAKEGLEQTQAVPGRLVFNQGLNHSLIIDDTYNASFDAVKSALDVLSQQEKYTKKYWVFGGMRELGEHTENLHQAIGLYAKNLGIQGIFTVGKEAKITAEAFGSSGNFETLALHFEEKTDLISNIKNQLDSKTAVLIKGSRGSKMEEVVKELLC